MHGVIVILRPLALVWHDAVLYAEQSESSVGLQHWYMVVGSGAIISAGMAMPFITGTFHPVV